MDMGTFLGTTLRTTLEYKRDTFTIKSPLVRPVTSRQMSGRSVMGLRDMQDVWVPSMGLYRDILYRIGYRDAGL